MRDLVVIGASLDGLRTLCRLIDQLPSPFHAPILAVLHSTGGQRADRMLGDCTARPVSYGMDGETVERGRVYLAPPERALVVASPGVLGVDAVPKVGLSGMAVDALFKSAARSCGPRVIGVLLAGGGRDGMDGLKAINAAGGIGVLQAKSENVLCDPRDAQAHYCLPLDDIAELLRRLVDGSDALQGADPLAAS